VHTSRTWLGYLVCGLALAISALTEARAHDIPNQRIDRAIQVSLAPGELRIDYEVSLTELTLTQDLRALIGGLPGADRADWLNRYGEVTGPLNKKGILVSIDGQPVTLAVRSFDLAIEEHPRYVFHFSAAIAREGRLAVRDTNYASSEGTSRLAVRGTNGVIVSGDDLPHDVDEIAIRPLWLLSDAEERRTKQVEVRFHDASAQAPRLALRARERALARDPIGSSREAAPASPRGRVGGGLNRLARLLDQSTGISWSVLLVLAMALGAAHAIQPGHGKTLVTAVALGPEARIYQPALLGLATAVAHLSTVLAIAVALWYTGATQVGMLHAGLMRIAGFAIAAAGLWRLGRYLGGFLEHDTQELGRGDFSINSLLGLGLAGGLVPCWDAVALLILAAAIGRLATGVGLVMAFSAGMALVLVAIGCTAWRIKSAALRFDGGGRWQRRLGLAAGVLLSAMGLYVFLQV
jgi:ABC-type nickel/cobalt efflux system permease component RcnA